MDFFALSAGRRELTFRQARSDDEAPIWAVLQGAIARRAADGSSQWQNGYPNPAVVRRDIESGVGYVLADGQLIVGYCAVVINDEPSYLDIKGRWSSTGDFVVVHRVAVKDEYLGRGIAQVIMRHVEDLARERGIPAVRVDTKDDNPAMLRVFEKLGYRHCGEVLVDGSPRLAFDKLVA